MQCRWWHRGPKRKRHTKANFGDLKWASPGCFGTTKEEFVRLAKPKGIVIGDPTIIAVPAPEPEEEGSEFGDDDYKSPF